MARDWLYEFRICQLYWKFSKYFDCWCRQLHHRINYHNFSRLRESVSTSRVYHWHSSSWFLVICQYRLRSLEYWYYQFIDWGLPRLCMDSEWDLPRFYINSTSHHVPFASFGWYNVHCESKHFQSMRHSRISRGVFGPSNACVILFSWYVYGMFTICSCIYQFELRFTWFVYMDF